MMQNTSPAEASPDTSSPLEGGDQKGALPTGEFRCGLCNKAYSRRDLRDRHRRRCIKTIGQERPSKRKSCETCAQKKLRCSMTRPACTRCEQLEKPCQYPSPLLPPRTMSDPRSSVVEPVRSASFASNALIPEPMLVAASPSPTNPTRNVLPDNPTPTALYNLEATIPGYSPSMLPGSTVHPSPIMTPFDGLSTAAWSPFCTPNVSSLADTPGDRSWLVPGESPAWTDPFALMPDHMSVNTAFADAMGGLYPTGPSQLPLDEIPDPDRSAAVPDNNSLNQTL
ncbi:hypothetical protein BDV25DRAFT_157910 [Aspergillus avenaceus]|uniref:Uncharacterized protein n=1 Tax=Aspergillus avenaceus TaxID=36643 RepID=A0A5N6TQI6_ASPAV|nr:hypothetical protein BDV25DRAFT_157910 [Aspergillus avenaceus]